MGLLDHVVDMTQSTGARERAQQIDAVRAELTHPRDAHTTDDSGRRVWTKPPHPTASNVRDALRLDPAIRSRLRLNEFSGAIEWEGRLLEDADITELRLALADTYKLKASVALMHEMIVYVARQLKVHPVREWLREIRWDGTPRIDSLLGYYAGCDDSDLNQVLSRRFMISCVARIMQPGAKVDTVLILAGPQGYGKSTFFRALAGAEWFRDSAIDLRNKDAYMALKGAWLYEMDGRVGRHEAARRGDGESVSLGAGGPLPPALRPEPGRAAPAVCLRGHDERAELSGRPDRRSAVLAGHGEADAKGVGDGRSARPALG
jgi:hypothetical protein